MTNMTSSDASPRNDFWQRFRDLGSLRRSTEHRGVAGVAEGLSRHFDIDPIIMRVFFVALTFFGGAGIILYAALWLTVPRDDAIHSIVSGRMHRDPQALITTGLAVGGVGAAVAMLGSISWAVPHPFSLLLIVVVAAVFVVAFTRRRDSQWSPPNDGGPFSPVPSTDEPAGPDGSTDMIRVDSPSEGTVATRAWWQRDDGPPPGVVPPPPGAVPPTPRRPKSHLFGLTMATIALALAALWIFDATSSYDLNPSVYPGTALGIIALALLAGTWWGRSRGLIAMGILASLFTAGAAFAGPGPYGDQVAIPTTASRLEPTYTLGIGQLRLHLDQISDIENLAGRHVTVDARFGRVLVVIPSSLAVTVDANVDHGRIEGPPGVQDGSNGSEHVLMTPPAAGRPALSLSIHLRFGQIEIDRLACPGAAVSAAGESTSIWKGGHDVAPACN
ncbi:MAG: hypothetical protein QOI51_1987 [Nocardioidaceae bacterium]|jgi:phage shock protein PspC (stress-responsive transcriptional regulator)|nr:hypothetical protein [Nocardioidaceae bacterium]